MQRKFFFIQLLPSELKYSFDIKPWFYGYVQLNSKTGKCSNEGGICIFCNEEKITIKKR